MALSITETIAKVKDFQARLNQIVMDAVERQEDQVRQFNVRQLSEGQDGEGQAIQPEYTDSTKRRKRRRGQRTDVVALRDTGRLYDRIFLQFEEDRFFIAADVSYLRYLVKRYGKDILGLNQDHVDQLAQLIKDDVQKEFEKALL